MFVTMEGVSKTIKGRTVLRDVSVAFERGRIYGVVGPNGSGKTMLLRAVCGFIRLDAGIVRIGGKPVGFNERLPEPVGVIIENPGFVLGESAMDNLKYLAGINRAFDERETDRLLTAFGLKRYANDKVKSFSLGMRQKLAVVQALMEHQRLVLLDEPTNGMDEESVGVFLDEMRRQRDQGTTVIIASHHRDELVRIADHLYVMNDGALHDSDA